MNKIVFFNTPEKLETINYVNNCIRFFFYCVYVNRGVLSKLIFFSKTLRRAVPLNEKSFFSLHNMQPYDCTLQL
jgi:hypothetical protein